MSLVERQIQAELKTLHARERGRLIVLTGARQTGKSTLAGMAFPGYPRIDLDSAFERAVYERMGPDEWRQRYPQAIIDEAQKLPAIFETIKACYDRDETVRYLLLGSSKIRLLSQVRETLAGRVALRELYPLALPELMAQMAGAERPRQSRLVSLLSADDPAAAAGALFPGGVVLGERVASARRSWESYLGWGGMPVLRRPGWTDEDRFEWLHDYQQTYLHRDLMDLTRINRLEPFARAQQAAALRTAQRINFADLARLSGVSPPTAREYLRYLEIGDQVRLLPGWYRNLEKRLTRQPKLHFLDPGIRRGILRKRGMTDGAEFESAVVAEVVKQCANARLSVELSHLRTSDGREVDLLVEREDGFVAIECKQTRRVSSADLRHLRSLDVLLDKPLLLGLMVSNDEVLQAAKGCSPPVWKVDAPTLLS